jgi:hypothetical protein
MGRDAGGQRNEAGQPTLEPVTDRTAEQDSRGREAFDGVGPDAWRPRSVCI